MLEVSLFINPLGTRCYNCENDLLRAKNQLPNLDLTYNFIPLVNMRTIEQTMKAHSVAPTLANRQLVSATLFQVTLDYKAALFQGRKRGRHFLLELQTALIREGQNYSEDLTCQIAKQIGLDLAMFKEDRIGKLSRKAFEDDQWIANEMGVAESSTAIIFNSDHPNYDTMVPNFDYKSLLSIIENGHQQSPHLRHHSRQPNFRTY
ncbi:DsbA family protein [Limosilactobacillus gorillae]|uniref:DsbA family protein n=1 Tax=Limosilactobacillus gorillae TaxID=1450649 RepID=UPI000B16AB66|nr:DsbA family protein [Limosilactobacillus gorillae]